MRLSLHHIQCYQRFNENYLGIEVNIMRLRSVSIFCLSILYMFSRNMKGTFGCCWLLAHFSLSVLNRNGEHRAPSAPLSGSGQADFWVSLKLYPLCYSTSAKESVD